MKDFVVGVECEDGGIIKGDVIGYDTEFETVKVKFHSDTLKVKKTILKEIDIGFGMSYDDNLRYEYVTESVPVKIHTSKYQYIILAINQQ